MAFTLANWDCLSGTVNANIVNAWTYKLSTDTLATIKTSAYFNDRIAVLKVGDILYAQGSDDYEMLRVTSITGNVTVAAYIPSTINTESITTVGTITAAILAATASLTVGTTLTVTGATTLNSTLNMNERIIQTATRYVSAYAYIRKLDVTIDVASAGAALKTYADNVSVTRDVGAPVTGDSNDAVYKASYSNYAPNDSNFIGRIFNGTIRNRSGGTLGRMDGAMIGSKNDSGATCPYVVGAQFIPENYGTVATEFGGCDAFLKNESNSATLTYGYRARNADLSSQTAIQHGLLVNSATLTSAGAPYTSNGFVNAVTVQQACTNFANFDDATGTCATETGTEPGTWLGRIKVIMPSGTAGYIKVWSVSNA